MRQTLAEMVGVDETGRYYPVDPTATEHTTIYWAKLENAYGPWEFKVAHRDVRLTPELEGFSIVNLRVWNRELRHEEIVAIYKAERWKFNVSPYGTSFDDGGYAKWGKIFREGKDKLAQLPDDEILAELEINNWPCGYEIIPKSQPRYIEFLIFGALSKNKTRDIELIHTEVLKAGAAIHDIMNIESTPSDTDMATRYRIELRPSSPTTQL